MPTVSQAARCKLGALMRSLEKNMRSIDIIGQKDMGDHDTIHYHYIIKLLPFGIIRKYKVLPFPSES